MKVLQVIPVSLAFLLAVGALTATPDPGAAIQSFELNATQPCFVPTHPRVTTTIRFPHEIGAPDGAASVFTEDVGRQAGEYLVSWTQGTSYFAITPLRDASLANLNVPYDGQTYVIYFYGVDDPMQAVAVVNLVPNDPIPTTLSATSARLDSSPPVLRTGSPPPNRFVAVTPARLLGFLDRLKLLHGVTGAALGELARAMRVQVAVGPGETTPPGGGEGAGDGVVGSIGRAESNGGFYRVILLRVVRDRRLNCIGFVCLIRNTSEQTLCFDVNSFGARVGSEYLCQRISDAAPKLNPGEQAPAYFIVQAPRNAPLLAANDWSVTVDLVEPRINPGASISRIFGREGEPR